MLTGAASGDVNVVFVAADKEVALDSGGKVTVKRGERFSISVDPKSKQINAKLAKGQAVIGATDLGLQLKDGCVVLSLETGLETDLISAKGTGEYGASSVRIESNATAAAQLAASVKTCVKIVPDDVLVLDPTPPMEQEMVVRPRTSRSLRAVLETQAAITPQLAQEFSQAATLEFDRQGKTAQEDPKIDAYCLDQHLEPPGDGAKLSRIAVPADRMEGYRGIIARFGFGALDEAQHEKLCDDLWEFELNRYAKTFVLSERTGVDTEREDEAGPGGKPRTTTNYEFPEGLEVAVYEGDASWLAEKRKEATEDGDHDDIAQAPGLLATTNAKGAAKRMIELIQKDPKRRASTTSSTEQPCVGPVGMVEGGAVVSIRDNQAKLLCAGDAQRDLPDRITAADDPTVVDHHVVHEHLEDHRSGVADFIVHPDVRQERAVLTIEVVSDARSAVDAQAFGVGLAGERDDVAVGRARFAVTAVALERRPSRWWPSSSSDRSAMSAPRLEVW